MPLRFRFFLGGRKRFGFGSSCVSDVVCACCYYAIWRVLSSLGAPALMQCLSCDHEQNLVPTVSICSVDLDVVDTSSSYGYSIL